MVKRDDHLVVKKELTATQNELKAARQRIAQLTAPKPAPLPAPPRPYVLQVPLGKDLWVRVEATRPLGERHWDRLDQILALQRGIGGDPIFAHLIEADVGINA